MNKSLMSMFMCGSVCCAVGPESPTTTTPVKEQIQRIEVPSHVKGLRIVNHNTLRLDDRAPLPYHYQPVHSKIHQDLVSEKRPASWQRTCIGGLVIASVYGALRAYVYLLAKELEKESHWWHWKSALSLSELTQLPEKELAHELLTEIQKRYDKKTVNDVAFIMPLVHFIQDTNYEQEYLEHLITVYTRLHSWNIQTLFGADDQALRSARDKLVRLTFIRALYMKWLSSYAVDIPTGY